ncbi:hypothetical protein [Beijerinckia mobilis]|uniref:hypothetical protein n=1 Tax=Beijerinckia mobilis TaxID=231434 RepID=UPI000553DAC4|nr:hypothetical protein [Beijerinckia mobilis]
MEEQTDAYSVDQADQETILIRHCAEAHRYAFFIVTQDGRRMLGDGVTIGNNATANDGADFAGEARLFAEAAARERNLID